MYRNCTEGPDGLTTQPANQVSQNKISQFVHVFQHSTFVPFVNYISHSTVAQL